VILLTGIKNVLMKATTIVKEMAKSRSIFGFAAGLYMHDELKSREFLSECYEQYRRHPEEFRACFGEKAFADFQIFWLESNN
jgi:hypothetical protein